MAIPQHPKFQWRLWTGAAVLIVGFSLAIFAYEHNEGRILKFWRELTADAYMKRVNKSWHEYGSDLSTNAQERLFEAGREIQKEYPDRINGYNLMMCAIEDSARANPAKASALADELSNSSAPEYIKQWAKGFLCRLDSQGKPIAMKFTAVDGREVDLEKLRGKVVLVDFWATDCSPCVAAIARLKAALETYQQAGFEIIGISCDTDKQKLKRFLEQKQISWPQYFDGHQQVQNRFTQVFGINGIPHIFLLDRKGCLFADNVWAAGSRTNFEDKIEFLLAEK